MIKKLILVLFGLFIACPTYADWSGDYINTHDISMANSSKQYKIENVEDTLNLRQLTPTSWRFELFAIARSANMCDIAGEAKQVSPKLLEYKQEDCTLTFEKKGKIIEVKDTTDQCRMRCGHGVYLNHDFTIKSKQDRKARQATPLRKVSEKAFKSLKGNWKEAIKEAYIHRSSKTFHNVNLNELRWYQSKRKDNKYYLFSEEQPYFIILNYLNKESWEFINIWKINYPENKDSWKLYPALYPISDRQDAIAVVYHGTESYSGGAAGFDVAKIIPLDASDSTLNFPQGIVNAMPFSCSVLTRACKSSEETEKFDDVNGKSRCHNKGSGYLTLKTILPSNKNQKYYNWQLTWHDRFLEGLSTSPENKTKQNITINLNNETKASCSTFDSFNFCGGGQDDYCSQVESPEYSPY